MYFIDRPHRSLLETALGHEPADLIIRDGTLIDVYSGRLLPHYSVAIRGSWIAYVGTDTGPMIGKETRIIEAQGRIMSPGYIDPHTHFANYCDLSDLLKYAIPGGTTTFVTEVESYAFSSGAEGLRAFLKQIRNRPVKIFCLVPPMVTLSPAVEPLFIGGKEFSTLLEDDLVLGLGESYWQNAILPPDDRVLGLIREALKAGKSVQGHAAGAYEKRLAAYVAAGAQSCHEAVSPRDILARLESGLYTMLREGYIRRDLESLRPLIGKIDLRRCTLCTDGVDPELLLTRGYFHEVVQKAVDMGVDPIEAVRMASLNPAEHFGLDHLVGGLSPGRFADILLLPALGHMKPDLVLSQGRIVSDNGHVTVPLPRVPYPATLLKTVNIPPITPQQLSVPSAACEKKGSVRTLDIQANGLVIREGSARVDSDGRKIAPNTKEDLLKVVFIERVSGKGKMFVGFVRGWGQRRGAVASSLAWDVSAVVAIGADDRDLALAINRVIKDQGSTVLAVENEIELAVPFPVGGYVSEKKIEDLAEELRELQERLTKLGVTSPTPHLTLITLTSAAIPFMRITEKGYFRFRENDYVGI